MKRAIGIAAERAWLRKNGIDPERQIELYPELKQQAASILLPKGQQQLVLSKVVGGNDKYLPETGKGYSPSLKQSPKRSALGNLPADEDNFSVATWLKSFRTGSIRRCARRPVAPLSKSARAGAKLQA